MSVPRLNLVVLRVADLERAVAFYRAVGLAFERHAHGTGPQHYASESSGFVFELYAATAEQPVSASTRVGFAIEDVDAVVARLVMIDGVRVVVPPKESEWGRRAVVADPDGHRVELVAAK
jgi:lactoylglutathione lyase